MPSIVSKRVGQAHNADRVSRERQEQSPSIRPRGAEGKLVEVEVSFLKPNPYQPRVIFDPVKLDELAASIASDGLLQPITMAEDKETGEVYIVAGQRRWEAMRKLGRDTIQAIDYGRREPLWFQKSAIVENVIRDDLKLFERIRGYLSLADLLQQQHPEKEVTKRELAEEVGESEQTIGRYMKIAYYPELMTELEELARAGQDASLNDYYDKVRTLEGGSKPTKKARQPQSTSESASTNSGEVLHQARDEDYYRGDISAEPATTINGTRRNPPQQQEDYEAFVQSPTPQRKGSLATRPPVGTFPFRGAYIGVLEFSEVLADAAHGIISTEAQDVPAVTAPYDIEELFRQYDELGMALKSRFGSR